MAKTPILELDRLDLLEVFWFNGDSEGAVENLDLEGWTDLTESPEGSLKDFVCFEVTSVFEDCGDAWSSRLCKRTLGLSILSMQAEPTKRIFARRTLYRLAAVFLADLPPRGSNTQLPVDVVNDIVGRKQAHSAYCSISSVWYSDRDHIFD